VELAEMAIKLYDMLIDPDKNPDCRDSYYADAVNSTVQYTDFSAC